MIWDRLIRLLRLPFQAMAVASGAKDFTTNPVLGSARLNRWGLHVWRKRVAHYLSAAHRRRVARQLPPALVESFNRQGYVRIDHFLPEQDFEALRRELRDTAWPMLERAQPPAVTHRAYLDLHHCKPAMPAVSRLLQHRQLRLWMQFAAGCPGRSIIALQRITSDSADGDGNDDPQTHWHSDTFHSAGKGWLFLHTVKQDEGPFSYVPGSHLATPARTAWEQAQSISAATHPNRLHAKGSFRVNEQEMREMGYAEPYLACVTPNTLIVADTSGFHRRTPSPKPTVRLEIYLTLRRNPFFAFLYPSVLQLPVVSRRWAGIYYRFSEYLIRTGRRGWIPRAAAPLAQREQDLLMPTE